VKNPLRLTRTIVSAPAEPTDYFADWRWGAQIKWMGFNSLLVLHIGATIKQPYNILLRALGWQIWLGRIAPKNACSEVLEGEMTKAVLKFDLPDEQSDFDAAVHGREALSVLWEIDQYCRGLLKHGSPTAEEARLAEEVRAMIPFHLLEK